MDDVTISDLRIGGGVLPNTYRGAATTTVTSGSGSVTTTSASSGSSRNADSNYRGQIQYMAGRLGHAGGLIYGVDAGVNQARFVNPGSTTTLTTPVLDILVG